MHLAEALALGLDGTLPADHPEKSTARPAVVRRDARLLTAAVVTVAAAAAGTAYALLRRRIRA